MSEYSRVNYFNTAKQYAKFIASHTDMTRLREAGLFRRVANHVEKSMRYGSPVTGAPGQPVRTGNLRDRSFFRVGSVKERDMGFGFRLSIAPYAPIYEDNLMGYTIRSKVGGYHSIKITRVNYRLIVGYELARTKKEINVR